MVIVLVCVAALLALLDVLGVSSRFNLTAVAVLLLCCAVAAGSLL